MVNLPHRLILSIEEEYRKELSFVSLSDLYNIVILFISMIIYKI